MQNFWYNPSIKFHIWDNFHLITLVLILLFFTCFYINREKLMRHHDSIRISVALLLILSRISLDFWYVTTGTWRIHYSLPVELCSIASLVCAIMLITKNHTLFRVFYFIALAGATQAILTPSLDFGFPQFRYIQFFTDHTLLLLAPLMMIWLYDFTLKKRDIIYAFLTINLLAGIAFIINLLTGSNYMFLMHKPASASLIDLLGPHPFYLVVLEVMALILFTILYWFYKIIR